MSAGRDSGSSGRGPTARLRETPQAGDPKAGHQDSGARRASAGPGGVPVRAASPHRARNGSQILEFTATVLGAATSARPGASRWTELTVYQLGNKDYVISKIGRSTVAHREDCSKVNRRRMRVWLEAGDEARVRRTACPQCSPQVGDRMDPQTWLECSRYTVLQARDSESLARVLLQGRPGEPPHDGRHLTGVIAEIIRQVSANDAAFGLWWESSVT